MEKPDVDHVEGLSPAISIEQKSTSHNPRSTVGTITEIYDYLRLLFARVGEPRCPQHGQPLRAQTVSEMVDTVLALPEGTKLMLLAPVVRDRKGEHLHVFAQLQREGFIRARVDGLLVDLDDAPSLDKKKKHTIEVVVDRFKVRPDIQLRLSESFETALNITDGLASISFMDGEQPDQVFSAKHACPECDYSLRQLEPRLSSFNNPPGACPSGDGLGRKQHFDQQLVVRSPEASLAQGAVRSWDKRTVYHVHMLASLAAQCGVVVDAPWPLRSEAHRGALVVGSGEEALESSYINARGDVPQRRHPFEGLLPDMEGRYRAAEALMV